MTWGERFKAAGRFAWTNFDAIVVIAVAVAIIGVDVVGEPNPELVGSITLALLAAMAFLLLRDRSDRGRVSEIADFVADLDSDRPYEVLAEVAVWDLGEDGSQAESVKTQKMRFTRDRVSVLQHWSTGMSGTVETCTAEWAPEGSDRWVPAENVHDFNIRNGKNVVFCLNNERQRGDVLNWRVTRILKDRFPAATERVSLRLDAPSHHPRMRVVWPKDRPPTRVELQREGEPTKLLKPQVGERGRLYVQEELPGYHAAGDEATIEWTW